MLSQLGHQTCIRHACRGLTTQLQRNPILRKLRIWLFVNGLDSLRLVRMTPRHLPVVLVLTRRRASPQEWFPMGGFTREANRLTTASRDNALSLTPFRGSTRGTVCNNPRSHGAKGVPTTQHSGTTPFNVLPRQFPSMAQAEPVHGSYQAGSALRVWNPYAPSLPPLSFPAA
jgi:hypothetical protein